MNIEALWASEEFNSTVSLKQKSSAAAAEQERERESSGDLTVNRITLKRERERQRLCVRIKQHSEWTNALCSGSIWDPQRPTDHTAWGPTHTHTYGRTHTHTHHYLFISFLFISFRLLSSLSRCCLRVTRNNRWIKQKHKPSKKLTNLDPHTQLKASQLLAKVWRLFQLFASYASLWKKNTSSRRKIIENNEWSSFTGVVCLPPPPQSRRTDRLVSVRFARFAVDRFAGS